METKAFMVHMPESVHSELKILSVIKKKTMAEIIIEKIKEAIAEQKNGDSDE